METIKEIEKLARKHGLRITFGSLPKMHRTLPKFKKIIEEGIMLKGAGFEVRGFGNIKFYEGTHHMRFAKFLHGVRNLGTDELRERKRKLERKLAEIATKVEDAEDFLKKEEAEAKKKKDILRAKELIALERNAIEEELDHREVKR